MDQKKINKLGGISSLVPLLESEDTQVREFAVACVCSCSMDGIVIIFPSTDSKDQNAEEIRRAGGISTLVKLLRDVV